MKNWKVLATSILVGTLCMSSAKAVEISSEDYNRLRNVFSDARISVMTEEEVNKYLSYDLENTITEDVYYKGVSRNNESYTWTEVSEEEYEAVDPNIMPAATEVSTNYKRLAISATPLSGGTYSFYEVASWKYMPAVRSYDVIAFRFRNVAILTNSQSGLQAYKRAGDSAFSSIGYGPNGTNISKQDAGFGISMNLVDLSIDAIELSLSAEGMVSGSDPYVYGAYQHAIQGVTLAQSKDYTISGAGFGNVVNFSPTQQNKFDGMRGVEISLK
ncbi:MAG: hypothetical protein K2M17_04000 [Bacilli bacterium]|nr:hypothetical protein [Bacilli bacterium]